MKVPLCESCKKEKETLESNPKGGCVKCAFHNNSDKTDPCLECFETYTPFNHYPKFQEKK